MSPSPIRTYEVTVRGFPPALYSARSPAKARARCYREYCAIFDGVSFRKFLDMSSVRLVSDPPHIGERIIVAGLPATRVIGHGQYIHYMRDDSDTVLCAHPLDVQTVPCPSLATLAKTEV